MSPLGRSGVRERGAAITDNQPALHHSARLQSGPHNHPTAKLTSDKY